MFPLTDHVTDYLLDATSIVAIPHGQLYLVRPLSPKSYSELSFRDGAATLRQTGQEYHHQLVVQQAYEKGEERKGGEGGKKLLAERR
ncbi:MAG: hypothetical protein Q9184_003679 [Pyrenodesmia sp. 2 TL-2023]